MAQDNSKQRQKFLDENQYTTKGILRYEKIFGAGFISTGGIETTEVSCVKI
jgi:phosphoethanolamine N-methyltransferase